MHFYVSTYSIYLKEVEYPLPINRLPIIFKEGHHGVIPCSPPPPLLPAIIDVSLSQKLDYQSGIIFIKETFAPDMRQLIVSRV